MFGKDGDDGFYSDDDSVSDAEGSSAAEQVLSFASRCSVLYLLLYDC